MKEQTPAGAGEASTQAEEVDPIVLVQTSFEKLKKCFKTGATRKYAHRIAQLDKIWIGLEEMKDEMCEAMRVDLGRDIFLNFIAEVAFI